MDLEYFENNVYVNKDGWCLGAILLEVWFHALYEYQKYYL